MDFDACGIEEEYIVSHPDLAPFYLSEFNLIMVLTLKFGLSGPHQISFFLLLVFPSFNKSFSLLEELPRSHRHPER